MASYLLAAPSAAAAVGGSRGGRRVDGGEGATPLHADVFERCCVALQITATSRVSDELKEKQCLFHYNSEDFGLSRHC